MHTKISKRGRVASHFVMLSFLAGIVSLSNGQAFEVVEADLEQAYTYINNEQYSQAQQIYEDVIRDYPGTEHAVRAQADLIGLNVILGRQQEAQASLEQLMRDFPGHEYIPEAISTVASEYLYIEQVQPQKTIELCEQVLANWPESKEAIWAKTYIVKANIWLGNESGAQSAYQGLLGRFKGNKNLPEAIFQIAEYCCQIADSWREINDAKSLQLYEYFMSHWPDYDYEKLAENDLTPHLVNIAVLRLQFGDDAGCRAAFEKMVNNSSESEGGEFGWAISEITGAYLNRGKAQEVLELLQYAQEQLSGTEHEIWAKAGIVSSHIALDDNPNDQQLNELLTEFDGHPELPQAIFLVAEQYYKLAAGFENKGNADKARQCLQKAITLWKNIPQDSDLSGLESFNEDRHFMIAETYRQLGQDKEAVEHYKKVVAAQPDHERASHIHFMIGDGYERLKKAKIVSASSADIEILSSYQKAVESDPDSPAAKIAAKRLKKLSNPIKGD